MGIWLCKNKPILALNWSSKAAKLRNQSFFYNTHVSTFIFTELCIQQEYHILTLFFAKKKKKIPHFFSSFWINHNLAWELRTAFLCSPQTKKKYLRRSNWTCQLVPVNILPTNGYPSSLSQILGKPPYEPRNRSTCKQQENVVSVDVWRPNQQLLISRLQLGVYQPFQITARP